MGETINPSLPISGHPPVSASLHPSAVVPPEGCEKGHQLRYKSLVKKTHVTSGWQRINLLLIHLFFWNSIRMDHHCHFESIKVQFWAKKTSVEATHESKQLWNCYRSAQKINSWGFWEKWGSKNHPDRWKLHPTKPAPNSFPNFSAQLNLSHLKKDFPLFRGKGSEKVHRFY